MRQRKHFYITTQLPLETWRSVLFETPEKYERFVGGQYWPYTLAEARAEIKKARDGKIFKFGLPFYNFIKEVE